MKKTTKWIGNNKESLLFVFRLFVDLLIFAVIILYFISGRKNGQTFYELLSFNVSSGIFWLIIILIATVNIDIFKDIIKDIARSKVAEFVNSEYYRDAKNKLLDDREFKAKIIKIANNLEQTGYVEEGDFSSGNKKEVQQ